MNLLHRAHFGFPARIRARSGVDLTGAFGFFALLRKALRELGEPAECVVAFDSESSLDSRMAAFPAYKPPKATSQPRAGDQYAWVPTIYRGLDLVGIAWVEADGHEADDVVAAAITTCRRRTAFVMSSDRDFHQLLGPRTFQLLAMQPAHRRVLGVAHVQQRYGVDPGQWCDYRALTGDVCDGIPGVRGVGPQRAAAALGHGGPLERCDWTRHGWWGARVAESLDDVHLWRELVRLRADVRAPEISGRPTADLPLAARVLDELGTWDAPL